ncbi:MAG: hypothetical protein WCT42_01960 [Candidatus Paceibacterota bacterium]|jgi:hypothetical protein
MKFLKTKKYSILSNFLKYSFVGVLTGVMIFSSFFVYPKLSLAAVTMTSSNITPTTAHISAEGLTPDATVIIRVIEVGNTPNYDQSFSVLSSNLGTASSTFTGLSPSGEYRAGVMYTGTSGSVGTTTFLTPASTSSAKDIISFDFLNFNPVVTGFIGANSVILTVPYGTNITALVPTISVSSEATVNPASGVAKNFTNNVTYVVTAGNGSTKNYTISVLIENSMPIMSPKITSFTPTSGKVGDVITIDGSNFNNVSSVLFNTTNTVTTTNTANKITVKVPEGATSGKITIKTSANTYSGDTSNLNPSIFTVTTISGTCLNGATDYPTCTPTSGGGNIITPTTGDIKFKGLVPICNTEVDTTSGGFKNPCNFNVLLAGVNRVINFLLITMATPLFALILVYVGWLYLSDMGSSENINKAKKIFKNVIIGYLIALAAWLIVKTLLATLGFDPKDAFLIL